MRQLRPQVAYLLDYKRFDKIQAHYAFLVEKSQRMAALVSGKEQLPSAFQRARSERSQILLEAEDPP